MKCKNRGGFTVIELLVYLGVVLGVLMINLMLIKVVQSGNPSEALFWRSFQSAWTRMTLNAKAENISYRISIRDKDVIFFPMKVKKTHYDEVNEERISVPRSIHVRSQRSMIAYDDGFASPTKIIWLDSDGNVKYDQKIQMGWSGYHVERHK